MKRMGLFSILLPLKYNDDKEIPKELFIKVQKFLGKKYNGVTWQENPRYPIKGLWRSPSSGEMISDELMLFSVATQEVNEARSFFSEYKEELKKDFDQQEIMIIEETIEQI